MFYKPYDETPTEGKTLINLKNPFKPTEPSSLEKEIERLFVKLANLPEASEEYDRVSNQVKKLYPLKETDSKKKVSADVLVGAATNLIGIGMVLNYEQLRVITTKAAFSLVGKKFVG